MKITSLELFKVAPRWLFLKTNTDEGISGWGEPVIEGRAETVAAAVRELSTYLIGRDPFAIEDVFQTLYRGGFYRGGSRSPGNLRRGCGSRRPVRRLRG